MKSFLQGVVLLGAVVAVSYTTLYFTKAEAIYSRTVGTISVSKFVPKANGNTEFLEMQFSGILGQDSTANLAGWLLRGDGGFEYDLSQIELTNKKAVRLCEQDSLDPNCDYYWQGNNVFDDSLGSLQVIARDGTPVVHVTYDTPSLGETFSGSGSYLDDVYTQGDKVTVCYMQNNRVLKNRSINARKLANEMETGTQDASNIIPPYVYEDNKKLGFHPGLNWPGGKEVLKNGCQ